MQKAITSTPWTAAVLVLGSPLWLLTGCMFSLDPGHIDPDSTDGGLAWLDGTQIELARHSTKCEGESSKSLTTEVGDGTEFSAEEMRTLQSPCAESGAPNPLGIRGYS